MRLTSLCAFVLCLSLAAAEEAPLPTIFVAPLDGDMAQIQGWQPALGEGLAEMLITEVAKLKKFQMLESTALKDLKEEIKLGEDGYAGKDERVDKGGFAGADFMFRGKVTRFGYKQEKSGMGGFGGRFGGSVSKKSSQADVRIDWRIVDAATRKVIKTGSAVGEEKGGGWDVSGHGGGGGGNISHSNDEFMNSALGKATVKALNAIMTEVKDVELPESGRKKAKSDAAAKQAAELQAAQEALRKTPGKVLAVPAKGVVIVSLGSKHGFKAGDTLNLLETLDTKDDKGEVVFTEEKPAGTVVLEAVQEDKSKAKYEGTAEVKAGWLVRAQ